MDLTGVIDLHVHSGPDVPQRKLSALEVALQARDAGMAAVFVKSHITSTAGVAALLSQVVPGLSVYGGLALDYPVGGLNPLAVTAAIGMGARIIFMPTLDSASDYRGARAEGAHGGGSLQSPVPGGASLPEEGLTIFAPDGSVLPAVGQILKQIAGADVTLATGHLSSDESEVLVGLALEAGVRRVVVTHALYRRARMSVEVQKKLAARGAYIEHCWTHTCPAPGHPALPLEDIVESIKAVGPEHVVMSTDCGQVRNPTPVEGMQTFIDQMSRVFSQADLRLMATRNPAFLLKNE